MNKKKGEYSRIVYLLIDVLLLFCLVVTPNEATGKAKQVSSVFFPASEYKLRVKTPAGVDPLDVAVGADNELTIQSGSIIQREKGISLSVNAGSGKTIIQPKGEIGSVISIGSVQLAPGAHAAGIVKSGSVVTVKPKAVVDQGIEERSTLTPLKFLDWIVTFPESTTEDVVLRSHQEKVLAPGRYGRIEVGAKAKLSLSSGVYFTESLHLMSASKLVIDNNRGTVVINIRDTFELGSQGSVEATYSEKESNELLVVVTGGRQVSIGNHSFFAGTIAAPNSPLEIGPKAKVVGALFGKEVTIGPGATVTYKPALQLLNVVPPKSLQACFDAVPPPMELDGREREIVYQYRLARYCSMIGEPYDKVMLYSRYHVDSFDAASKLLGNKFTPAEYLALKFDRRRKMILAENDPSMREAMCSEEDSDFDWIPDSIDSCSDTSMLVATDDKGCPAGELPPAPSAEDVQRILSSGGLLMNPRCAGAAVPYISNLGTFYRPANKYAGTYIFSGRVNNQPEGCPVLYDFMIEELNANSIVVRGYHVAFWEHEAYQKLVGMDKPVPSGIIQFNPLPSDSGSRGWLGSAGGNVYIRFKVRAMNGNGARGPWSDWMFTTNDDCRTLGFTCGGN